MTSAILANTPAAWERQRGLVPDRPPSRAEPCPTYGHRIESLLGAIVWCWNQQGLLHGPTPPALLDISAGSGAIGVMGRTLASQGVIPAFHYAATEQSPALCDLVRAAVPGASLAEWRFESDVRQTPRSLAGQLAQATDRFLVRYPVVVLSHVLEHVTAPYGLLDEAWSLVADGGFLVVCVPRNDEHRTHTALWDWNALLGVLRQYTELGQPLAVWEYGYWSDLIAVVPKGMPGTTGTPGTPGTPDAGGSSPPPPAPPAPAPPAGWMANGVPIQAHVDQRLDSHKPLDPYLAERAPVGGG
jgi:hypothetical protein